MAETAKDRLLRHADYLDRQGRRTLAADLRSWVETLLPILEAAKQSVEYHAEREVDYPGYVWIEWNDLVQFVAAAAGAGHIGDVPLSASEPTPPKAGR